MRPLLVVAALLLLGGLAVAAGPEYRVQRTAAPRAALLGADETAWRPAAVIAWGPARYETRFRALWSEEGLHLRFDATDPDPWHTMTKRDEHIWDEEVVEIFLDLDRSGTHYYELEINPANVVCDLHMISPWPEKKSDITWDLQGLETRVHTRKDAAGHTEGWTATALLPWPGFRTLPSARSISLPPKPGDAWRFNVFRIKRPGGPKAPEKDAVFAAWSPPAVRSFHSPEAFRPLVFEGSSGADAPTP
jgi:hypothetical protein